MFNFASADAFDPLLWSGMLVVMTLAALGLMTWRERRTRHGHRRHGDTVVRSDLVRSDLVRNDRGATPSVR